MDELNLLDLFKELQLVIPEIAHAELFLDSKWGSKNPHYRLELRQTIQTWIHQKQIAQNLLDYDQKIKNLLDLNLVPQLSPLGSVSVSHTLKLGGFLGLCNLQLTTKHPALGFDIEELDRIKEDTVKRVCSAQELIDAPEFKYLWGAKEALFKASNNETPSSNSIKLLSEIQLSNWTKISKNWTQADFNKNQKKVWVAHNQNYLISIASF